MVNLLHGKKIICNSKASPKSTFVTWLALHNRLATKDRMLKWNMISDGICSLCQGCDEDLPHLVFECSYTTDIWTQVLPRSGVYRAVGNVRNWSDEVLWA